MEAPFTLLQIKNTACCVAVRTLEHGSGQAKCTLISDRGTVMEEHTLLLPLASLQHGKNRRDLNMLAKRTLSAYFSVGKDYGNNQLCFMFSDGSADIVMTLAIIYLVWSCSDIYPIRRDQFLRLFLWPPTLQNEGRKKQKTFFFFHPIF